MYTLGIGLRNKKALLQGHFLSIGMLNLRSYPDASLRHSAA